MLTLETTEQKSKIKGLKELSFQLKEKKKREIKKVRVEININ